MKWDATYYKEKRIDDWKKSIASRQIRLPYLKKVTTRNGWWCFCGPEFRAFSALFFSPSSPHYSSVKWERIHNPCQPHSDNPRLEEENISYNLFSAPHKCFNNFNKIMYSYYRTASVSQTTISYYFSNRTKAQRSRNPQPGTVYTLSILERTGFFHISKRTLINGNCLADPTWLGNIL